VKGRKGIDLHKGWASHETSHEEAENLQPN